MVTYNSQRVNNDPFPVFHTGSGERASLNPGERRHYIRDEIAPGYWYEPRPEYDNNPNPLLLEIREVNEKYPGSNMATYEVNYMAMQSHGYAVEQSVPHVLHALKVLEKLVRVYGDDK